MNIARLLDGGTTSEDLPYFVMEYIEGEAVTHFCKREKPTLEERLRLSLQICAAISHADFL